MAQLIDFVENEFTYDQLENASVADDYNIDNILRPIGKNNNFATRSKMRLEIRMMTIMIAMQKITPSTPF